MPTILAIETSADLASAALLRDDQLLVEQATGVQTHSDAVLPMVQRLLSRGGLSLKQCDAVAFGNGPGSFTGVRTACGVVQGLAFGSGLPVVQVSTLLAMAQTCRNACGADEVMAILDARMGEVYWAQYRYAGGWQTVSAPALATAQELKPQGKVQACGNGLSAYAAAFQAQEFAASGMSAVMPHAADVAHLARDAFLRGEAITAMEAQPFYLRNKVALTTSERAARAAGAAA
jgi:tRNA threonylcarbamoyladenosine biosynthesis protein TsaB